MIWDQALLVSISTFGCIYLKASLQPPPSTIFIKRLPSFLFPRHVDTVTLNETAEKKNHLSAFTSFFLPWLPIHKSNQFNLAMHVLYL